MSRRFITLQLFTFVVLGFEACPLGLTPTASTTAMIVLTDALALLTMEEKGFTKEDFAMRHHGGYLGQKSREK